MPLWLSMTADPMMRDMVFVIEKDQWLSLTATSSSGGAPLPTGH